jgi:hypothetical protein
LNVEASNQALPEALKNRAETRQNLLARYCWRQSLFYCLLDLETIRPNVAKKHQADSKRKISPHGLGSSRLARLRGPDSRSEIAQTTARLGAAYTAPGVFTGGTTTCGGGEQTSYGVGLNWYPNLNMKFMLDYEHGVIDNPQVYGGPNYRGAVIDWIAGRTQIVF